LFSFFIFHFSFFILKRIIPLNLGLNLDLDLGLNLNLNPAINCYAEYAENR
jgi:hypothetical protein